MYHILLVTLLLFFSPSSQQTFHYSRGQSFFYQEEPLPNATDIVPTKTYEWNIGLIGSYKMPFSATSAYIMQFAADEINRNPDIIPGVKINLKWADVYYVQSNTIMATLYEILINNVRAIAGGFTSAETANIQLAAKLYGIPQVTGKATTEDFADRTNYPNFARTTIGDQLQVNAMLELFEHHGWKKAILIYTNEQYGVSGNGMMLASDLTLYSVKISNTNYTYDDALDQVQKNVDKFGARIFVFYLLTTPGAAFLKAMKDRYSTPDYVFIFTTPLASAFVETPASYLSILPDIDGAILISAADGMGSEYDAAKEKWNRLNATEYPGLRPEPHSFWYWYDTIFLFAHALQKVMTDKGVTSENLASILDNVTYQEYYNAITSVQFHGTTGMVSIDNSTGDRLGDVGVWNIRNGTMVTIGRYHGNVSMLEMYQQPVFFGGSTAVPLDTAPLPIKFAPKGIQIAFGILTAICVCITLLFAFFLFFNPIAFKKSGIFYCGVMIFGALLAYVAAFTTLPTPTDGLCLAFPWFLGLGFMIVFGCLFLKTWALFTVFRAAEKMKRTNLSPVVILKILGVFVAIEVIFMIVWSAVDPPKAELVEVRGGTHRQVSCSAGNTVFWAVFVGYKGLWMLFGAVISILVRNVREDYNESTSIGMAVYNCFGVTIVAVVLAYLLNDDPNVTVVIQVIAILIAFTFTLILMFFRPLEDVFAGEKASIRRSVSGTTAGSSGSNTTSMRVTTRSANNSGNSASANSASASASAHSSSMERNSAAVAEDGVFRV